MAKNDQPADTVTLTAPNGMQVSVAKSKEAARLAAGYRPVEQSGGRGRRDKGGGGDPSPYAGLKVDELRAEIDKRNDGREDDALIPTDGNKPDLVAALEADDKAQA
ncbi:hypothetical protein GCM10023340_08460 [Nocardioides marinquilinus]|uniref:Uncharacterized protein n=1 Tax=Nocardioides marinquilinus TaxID=1210400 RepID=A0ABP9PDT2_9ACTN